MAKIIPFPGKSATRATDTAPDASGARADLTINGRPFAHITNHYPEEIFIGDTRTKRPLAVPGHNHPKEGVTYPLIISYAGGRPHHHFNAAVMAAFDTKTGQQVSRTAEDWGVGIYADLSRTTLTTFRR